MANIEKVANGWIIRGKSKETGKPISFVAYTKEDLFKILLEELEL